VTFLAILLGSAVAASAQVWRPGHDPVRRWNGHLIHRVRIGEGAQ
jgi:hypothetical protein